MFVELLLNNWSTAMFIVGIIIGIPIGMWIEQRLKKAKSKQ